MNLSRKMKAQVHEKEFLDDSAAAGEPLTSSEGDVDPDHLDDLSRWGTWNVVADRLWVYEALACCFSLACLAGVVAMLRHYDAQPRPVWAHQLSLNSWIAILATSMKIAILFVVSQGLAQHKWNWFSNDTRQLSDLSSFDQARSGPWGAISLLFRWRYHTLTKVGALLVLSSLAIDPFAQAVVTYGICGRAVPATAALPRPSAFDLSNALLQSTGPGSRSLKAYLLSSLVSPDADITPKVTPVCSTGNCTFQAAGGYYQSLGVAHHCTDITSDIDSVTVSNGSQYSLSAPDDVELDVKYDAQYANVLQTWVRTSFLTNWDDWSDLNITSIAMLWLNSSTYFASDAARMSQDGVSRPTAPTEGGAAAARCIFTPVIRTLSSTVESGVLKNTEIKVDPLQPRGNTSFNLLWWPLDDMSAQESIAASTGMVQRPPLLSVIPQALRNGTLVDCKASREWKEAYPVGLINVTNSSKLPNSTSKYSFSAEDMSTLRFYQPDCLYYLSLPGLSALSRAVEELFGTRDSPLQAEGPPRKKSVSALFVASVQQWIAVEETDTMHLSSLWNFGRATYSDVDAYGARIADVMNAIIATQMLLHNATATFTYGTTTTTTTCAYVRWGWISLPAALVVLSAVFLLLTVITSSRYAAMPSWPGLLKSSSLTLLFYKPVADLPADWSKGPMDPTAMQRKAERLRSGLQRRS